MNRHSLSISHRYVFIMDSGISLMILLAESRSRCTMSITTFKSFWSNLLISEPGSCKTWNYGIRINGIVRDCRLRTLVSTCHDWRCLGHEIVVLVILLLLHSQLSYNRTVIKKKIARMPQAMGPDRSILTYVTLGWASMIHVKYRYVDHIQK